MNMIADEHGNLTLKKIYTGLKLETEEGNSIGVCMRDDTVEINVMPSGADSSNWWRVDMTKGTIEKMGAVRSLAEALQKAEDRLREIERISAEYRQSDHVPGYTEEEYKRLLPLLDITTAKDTNSVTGEL